MNKYEENIKKKKNNNAMGQGGMFWSMVQKMSWTQGPWEKDPLKFLSWKRGYGEHTGMMVGNNGLGPTEMAQSQTRQGLNNSLSQ